MPGLPGGKERALEVGDAFGFAQAHLMPGGVLAEQQIGHERHAEGIGYPEELVDADVADAVLYFREVPLVDVRHEGELLLRDALGLAHLHDVLAQLPSFVEIIHTVKAI